MSVNCLQKCRRICLVGELSCSPKYNVNGRARLKPTRQLIGDVSKATVFNLISDPINIILCPRFNTVTVMKQNRTGSQVKKMH